MKTSTSQLSKLIRTDFLVIGSGLAGLLAALKLGEAGADVVIASKECLQDSNTSFAQGGLAVSLPSNQFDSPELHFADTLKSGCGLVDPLAAHEIIFAGTELIEELARFGVHFDSDGNGGLSLSFEGGHSRPRVVHDKDATGRSITHSLILTIKELAKKGNVHILEDAFSQSLLLRDQVCLGAQLEVNKRTLSVIAGHTILATGGLGQIYARTTNPAIATGDGIALAYKSGAALVDMEFVQFHPTALAVNGAPAFLISEAVRGAGAILTDQRGKPFMAEFHKDRELATRDIVARAIQSVMQREGTNEVLLDLTPIGSKKLLSQFPNIVKTVRQFGIDALKEPIPVSPAAHYFMGGIMTDVNGNTTVKGLSAIGECASTGLHGANRLASNSLLEAGVMAVKSAEYLLKSRSPTGSTIGLPASHPLSDAPTLLPIDLARLKTEMYESVGLIRSDKSLKRMLSVLSESRSSSTPLTRAGLEAANIYWLAQLITKSALLRKECRGAHFREDYQLANDSIYAKRLVISRSEYSWLPVESNKWKLTKPLSKQLLARGSAS
ncbi:MAG: L-aspartate oxidase [Candidatus Melainabacteria bacterium]|nr:MAG: L-aspartate oxidase [Candidatus Melainabacteria bacterium]